MQQTNKYNRDYITFQDDYGRIPSFQVGLFASSGHGKGLAEEGFIEEWKKSTGGIVIVLADPKNEAEFSFIQYKPKEKYHLNQLKKDGIEPKSYPCKLYHPFTFNIPKSYLPNINFYTFPIKEMEREDWSILSESKQDSATIKMLLRAKEELGIKEGMFSFLHLVEKLSEGKKKGRRIIEDPNNFYLKNKGGSSKSVTEISNLMGAFKQNYFLRSLNCEYKLNWEEILSDSENYHVFLSMWLGDLKLKEFCVSHLLNSAVKEIQRLSSLKKLKKPVLFVIPEIRKLCPFRPEGYKEFLAESIADAMNTIRSVGRGVSLVYDSQNWSKTDDRVRNVGDAFFGKLGSDDKNQFCKARSYTRDKRELLTELFDMKCCFLRFEHEEDGIYRFFLPSHMHKEENYNWVEMWEKYKLPMKIYNDLIKKMKKEYNSEENEIKEKIRKRKEREKKIEEQKKKEKEEKQNPKKEEKESVKVTLDMKKYFYKLYNEGMSYRDIEKKIKEDPTSKIKPSFASIRNYIQEISSEIEKSE